ncbi:MAG: flagellar biosynthetic protein FliO [Planctomycetota bacterium]|nr:flagellar biosynthetic protein FliO [Planctomycetota bacterium]
MTGQNKKIIVLVAAVALLGGAMMMRPAQSDTAKTDKPLSVNSHSLFSDPNSAIKPQGTLDTGRMFLKMMLAVGLIIAMGVGAIYFSRKLLPKIGNLPGKKIQVIETVHLGPRKAVHLLRVGNQHILIGSTAESISKLADINDGLSETDLLHKDDMES